MLKEIRDARQPAGEPRRRCFSDADTDLYVWYDADGAIAQFQLCYDKGPDEKAFTWSAPHGVVHHGVDDGSMSGRFTMKGTPILTGPQPLDVAPLRALFQARGAKLEHDLYAFVLAHLEQAAG